MVCVICKCSCKQKTAYEMHISDWSSDVCSSDLICAGCAWPERFDLTEIQKRRKETRTLNAWDSQYGLEAKPLTEVRLRSEEHTSELQSLMRISYAVFCLKKKNQN